MLSGIYIMPAWQMCDPYHSPIIILSLVVIQCIRIILFVVCHTSHEAVQSACERCVVQLLGATPAPFADGTGGCWCYCQMQWQALLGLSVAVGVEIFQACGTNVCLSRQAVVGGHSVLDLWIRL
jgi:hypothetical protein